MFLQRLASQTKVVLGAFYAVSRSDPFYRLDCDMGLVDGPREFTCSSFDVRLQFRADLAAHNAHLKLGAENVSTIVFCTL